MSVIAVAPEKWTEGPAPWLARVPTRWTWKRLKYVALLLNDKAEYVPGLEYLGLEHIESWSGRRIEPETPVIPDGVAHRFSRGDVLFGKLRPYLAKVLCAEGEGTCSTEALVLRPRLVEQRYLFYYLISRDFIHEVDGSTYGSKMPRASWDFIGNMPCLLPPLPEQRAIAAWLDDRTKRIDELVAAKRRLIDLLAEQRTALITKAVTKGLNPDAPMKPSGIDWLGNVPRHWENWKVFHGFRVVGSGTTPKSDEGDYYDGDVLWVTTTELRETVIMDTIKKLTPQAVRDYSTLKTYPPGTLLFAMYGATIGRMGILGVPATVNQACCALSGGKALDEKFVYYWLWMRRRELIAMATGGGQPNLSQDDLREIRIPAPSMVEQKQIVDHIESKCFGDRGADRVVASVLSAIEKLIEYRQSVITAAVTGRIDVRQGATA